MNGFLYGVALQWKLDIRSNSLLVTCYIVPLIFFLLMGGIFTSVMPEMGSTLIQSMTVMSVSMGAFIGLPPSLTETYGSDIKKVYKANGVPVCSGLVTMFLSAFVHLMITCVVIVLLAPVLFEAALPAQLPLFFLALAVYIIVSLSIGSVLNEWKCFRVDSKKSGETDNDSTTGVFALNYAFGNYVSHSFVT